MSGSTARTADSERRLQWAIRFGLAGLFLGALSRFVVVDLDVFHQMAHFREALALGWIPRNDVFAYTPTVHPVVHYEWGHGAVLYGVTIASGLGATGLVALRYLLAGATALGCYVCARRRGASDTAFSWLAVVAIALGWLGFTTVRALVFTLFFLTCLLLLLEEDRRGRRGWWVVWLPLYVVWANIHAGFIAGLGLFGLYAAERFAREFAALRSIRGAFRRTQHLAISGMAMVLLPLINPYGWDYLPGFWRAVRLERVMIGEWRPLWQGSLPISTLTLFGVSLALVVYAAVRRGPLRLPGLAMVLVPAWLALEHMRHASIYALVWICYAPAYLEETGLGREIERIARKRAAILTALWLIFGALGFAWATHNHFWELRIPTAPGQADEGVPIYPAGAVDYLAGSAFSGNVMVPFEVGAYVSFKLHPSVKVSFDARYDAAYPPGALEENAAFYGAQESWRAILARYPTDAVLVPRSSPIEEHLERLSHAAARATWRRVYRDDGFSLFARASLAAQLPHVDRIGQPIDASFP